MKRTIFAAAIICVLSLLFAASVSAGPALERIIKKGELMVGTSGHQPPMTAVTRKGEIIGFDADIAKAMAAAMNVRIKFVTLPFAELLPALEAGKVDLVLSGLTMTPARNLKVAFVGPYYVSGKGILAKSEKYAALQNAKGLNVPEVSVAALKNSTSQKFAESLMPRARLVLTGTYDEAIELLLTDKVDVVIADFPFCALTAYRFSDKGLMAGKSPLTFEPLGIAMPEDTLLINWVDNFMKLLQGSGQLKEMHDKWLSGGSWIEELP